MKNKEKNICNLCPINNNEKCDKQRHEETGFCLVLFKLFSIENNIFSLIDSIKEYLKRKSIIF